MTKAKVIDIVERQFPIGCYVRYGKCQYGRVVARNNGKIVVKILRFNLAEISHKIEEVSVAEIKKLEAELLPFVKQLGNLTLDIDVPS